MPRRSPRGVMLPLAHWHIGTHIDALVGTTQRLPTQSSRPLNTQVLEASV